MKIKIKAQSTPQFTWPSQYEGKEVEVDIERVIFPDGTHWTCHASPDVRVRDDASNGEKSKSSFVGFFGETPARMTVEWPKQ